VGPQRIVGLAVRLLRAYYADSDSALAELLGRDLPWKES
jgi:hypothetical protein